MSYIVVWRNEVLDKLADIYVGATSSERARMALSVTALNRRLESDPHSEGESRGPNVRMVFISLLVVRFRIDDQTREVRVVGIRRYGR